MAVKSIEAIIINCSTKEQTALALLSAVHQGELPVTVIDCESTDGSFDFFQRLARRLPFTLARMPLRRHGDSLDRIFAAAKSDALLLLDSDAEILRSDLVPQLGAALTGDAYGSGFLHRGQWLGANHLVEGRIGYYAPRMWIPCVLLDVAPVRAAIAAGLSFRARTIGNEIPRLRWLSQLLYLRFRVPLLRHVKLELLASQRAIRFGARPHYVYYDTGAAMHDYLAGERGMRFAALPDEVWGSAVRHHHGVTRHALRKGMRNAADVDATRKDAIERIRNVYGNVIPELESTASKP